MIGVVTPFAAVLPPRVRPPGRVFAAAPAAAMILAGLAREAHQMSLQLCAGRFLPRLFRRRWSLRARLRADRVIGYGSRARKVWRFGGLEIKGTLHGDMILFT